VDDIRLFHQGLDVVVQSSDNEGTPNAILEAMAMGTPIVANGVGGTAELARPGREASIVPRRDRDALSTAIIDALRDRAGAAVLAAAARARVETELSFEARMRRLEAIYDELIVAFPSPAPCANS
ncbi:MAG: glycosyltransferase, partial [Vicinamibacterales bacterium]